MNESTYPYMLTSGVKLIGITGKAGAGKDTIADYLYNTYKDYYYEPFAWGLKQAAKAAFCLEDANVTDRELKEQVNEFWGVSPRSILQFMGTEFFRDNAQKLLPGIGSDFWIKRMYGRLEGLLAEEDSGAYEPGDTIIIPDLRFQNEYDFIRKNGGIVIHVKRPEATGEVGITGHASEAGFIFTSYPKGENYEVINDGTIADLHRKVANIIISATQF